MLPFSNLGLARCEPTAEGTQDSGCSPTFLGHAPPRPGSGRRRIWRAFEVPGVRVADTPLSVCSVMSPPRASRRTREEVDATLQVAKLKAAELLPTVHCLSFGPGTGGGATGDFCLLELEPALCQQLEAGDR